jgi:beta-lactamase superfamily II metal-dependent hydrolase
MGIRFEFLRAGNGDCIWITTEEGVNILIDGGLANTYNREIKNRLKKVKKLDLVILTHYDNDHIGGILKLLENEIKSLKSSGKTILREFWFNSFDKMLVNPPIYSNQTSARQQIQFDDYIKELIPFVEFKSKISIDIFSEMYLKDNYNIQFVLLSPNNQKLEELYNKYQKETIDYKTSSKSDDYHISIEELAQRDFQKDTSLTNGASIAFIMKYKKLQFLFLADAHIDLIVRELKRLGYSKKNRLKIEFVKLSHHGSSKNLNSDFLDLIDCNRFIISTNGGRHKHPNKETLAKILTHNKRTKDIEFIYNYEHTKNILTPSEKRKYRAIFSSKEVIYR